MSRKSISNRTRKRKLHSFYVATGSLLPAVYALTSADQLLANHIAFQASDLRPTTLTTNKIIIFSVYFLVSAGRSVTSLVVNKMRIELCVALVPSIEVERILVGISKLSADNKPIVTLDSGAGLRLKTASHVTLLQVSVMTSDLDRIASMLDALVAEFFSFDLQAKEFSFNSEEGSFEVKYEVSQELLLLQKRILDVFNPFRGDLLLERNPAGIILDVEGNEMIRLFGFPDIGAEFFSPHATLNWFDLTSLPAASSSLFPAAAAEASIANGKFPSLAVYCLGPRGTCPQQLYVKDFCC